MATDPEAPSVTLSYSIDSWEHSPANPRQWSSFKKWQAMAIVSLYSWLSILGTTLMNPALIEIAIKYDITNTAIVAMTLSVFFLSFALAPMIFGPLSEMYGRTWIFHITNLFHAAFSLGCAFAPSTWSLIAFRFLAGWAAGPAMAIAGGTVDDLFTERERGLAMALYVTMPFFGLIVGPIAGGYIVQNIGLKYIFIIASASCGAAASIGIPFLKETYAPVIRSGLADPEKLIGITSPKSESVWHILWLNISRPVMLLTQSFICFILSLYFAMLNGINVLMLTTFPMIFADVYHLSHGNLGLVYIGPGIGYVIGAIFGAQISNKVYTTLADRNGGKGTPEMRIPSLILASLFIPIGLLWYGWSAAAKIHLVMPLIGAGIFGFGYVTALLPVYLYLVDAFAFPASAISAAAFLQSLLGFAFPLFGQDMYIKLGYGGGNTLLAGLAIVIGIPFPIWIWYKGEGIRRRSAIFLSPDAT